MYTKITATITSPRQILGLLRPQARERFETLIDEGYAESESVLGLYSHGEHRVHIVDIDDMNNALSYDFSSVLTDLGLVPLAEANGFCQWACQWACEHDASEISLAQIREEYNEISTSDINDYLYDFRTDFGPLVEGWLEWDEISEVLRTDVPIECIYP